MARWSARDSLLALMMAGRKGSDYMAKLSAEEKKIIDNIEKSISKLSDEQKNKVLIFSEAVAMIADRNCRCQT